MTVALRKGKVATKKETVAEEVESQQEEVGSEEEADEMPFKGGDPVDQEEAATSSEPSSKEVAVVDEAPVKAVAAQQQKGGMIAGLAEDGFEGLELGFGSFPIIALKNEGTFEDTEGGEYDEAFDCIIQSTRTKYVIKNTKCLDKEQEVIYSYDGVTDTNEQPVQSTIDEWAEEGWGWEKKAYLEVAALLVDEDGNAGDMVLLSVPKTSTKRLSGYIAQNRMRRRLLPTQYITRCEVGEKIQNVDFPFFPWKFAFVEAL